jgi:hypothetical protein
MFSRLKSKLSIFALLLLVSFTSKEVSAQSKSISLSKNEYVDRVQAIWTAQMLGAMMGWPFEHKVASTEFVTTLPPKYKHAPVDDDWYYEMVAIRAFERYGANMSIEQLGRQWLENSAGSWGSSEQARILMSRGILPPDCGSPRYNKLWFTIGPQFSSDVYGALAPGMPNVAAALARKYGHINGYAEAVDGGVFIATMISLGFSNSDPKTIVRKAAQVIHPSSPYRKCIDMVIDLATKGKSEKEIFEAIEDRWHMEYPATNNAVANGGIVAACVWFGGGNFLKTINLAFGAADFTDADCNAANAGSVVAAMYGMKSLPMNLVKSLNDSIVGEKMGKVILTPKVNETISGLAKRTAATGIKILQQNRATFSADRLDIPIQEPLSQAAEVFVLGDLMKYWNDDWKLDRAGFGGAGGGMPGIRGITFLDSNVLGTYPRDEVRGVVLSRTLTLHNQSQLSFDAGVDSGRVWNCEVYINNKKVFERLMEGTDEDRKWYTVSIDLTTYKDREVTLRLYQRVLTPGRATGNAYWKNLIVE